MLKVPKLTLSFFCPGAFSFHISRLRMRESCQIHRHDFVEVFWVEDGRGTHLINGHRQPLLPGTLVTIRLGDCHGFSVMPGTDGFTLVNVAFRPSTLDFLRKRYFADAATFFWAKTDLPFSMQLNPTQLSWLQTWASHLVRSPRTQLAIDGFLLELLLELQLPAPAKKPLPAWLQHAMEAIRDPRHLSGGTRTFASLAGRSPQHVNFALKQHCNLTATEVVNQARMEHAAAELTMSQKKIIEICLECGFQNLGHFYQVFHHYYATTPRLYRQRQRAMLP
ncbi:MAG: HTH-type transcriptional activator RhaS [Verrucomicrobiae bacterium]|nr:HTH-type transcriptional activator RhaS [Verrucomicrobiae bacterium]